MVDRDEIFYVDFIGRNEYLLTIGKPSNCPWHVYAIQHSARGRQQPGRNPRQQPGRNPRQQPMVSGILTGYIHN